MTAVIGGSGGGGGGGGGGGVLEREVRLVGRWIKRGLGVGVRE